MQSLIVLQMIQMIVVFVPVITHHVQVVWIQQLQTLILLQQLMTHHNVRTELLHLINLWNKRFISLKM